MITYRKATVDDAKALLTYKKQVFDESDYLSRPGSEYNVTVEEEAQQLEEVLKAENTLVWVAAKDDEIISYLHMNPSNLSRMKHSAVLGITVKKSYRGQGIGKKMLEEAIRFFEASSLHRLELTVVSKNEIAIALYKKFGFVEEGLMKDVIKKGDTYYDVLAMARLK